MGERNAVCPNCLHPVPNLGLAGRHMLRCALCGVQFLVEDGAAELPPTPSPPPALRPARPAPNLVLQSAPAGATTAAQPPVAPSAHEPRASQRRRTYGPLEIVKVVAGGVVGLGLGYLVVLAIQSGRNREPNQPQAAPVQPQTVARHEPQIEFPQFNQPPRAETSGPVSLPPVSFTPPSVRFEPAKTPQSPVSESTPPAGSPSVAVQTPAATHVPAASLQPLEGLSDVLKLPSLVDTAPVVLSRLHLPVGMTLGMAVNTVAANIPAEAAFLTEAKAGSPATWLICYLPDTSGTPNDKRVLAEMQHAAGELLFSWRTPIEDADARKELSNCLLKLSCGDVSKTSLLRGPVPAPRLALDLQREVQMHSWPATDLPREESLRLEIVDLPGFPTGSKLKEDRRVLKLKERTSIQFEHVSGAEIQLEFRRVADNLQIVLRPEFRENAADTVPMTLPRLAILKANLQKGIPESEARIKSLGKELKSLDRQLKDLGGRPASGPAFIAWQGRLRNLQSAASSAKSKLSRLQRQLPEMKARLANAPQLERFLGDLNTRGTLKMQLYAECGDARLVVMDMTLDPITGQ